MIRTFEEHAIREHRYLDGLWDFVVDADNVGMELKWYEQFPETNVRKAFVPGCWNNEAGLYDYEGAAWYRTTFHLPTPRHIRLVFHAVLGRADVYLNGEHLGSHEGGFVPFEFVVPDRLDGKYELVVRTDNKPRHPVPLDRLDRFQYGGIIRPVELQRLADVYIEKLRVHYTLQGNQALVDVTVKLRNIGAAHQLVPLTVKVDGNIVYAYPAELAGGATETVTIRQTWEQVRLWNIGQPELYVIQVDTETDDIADRIGFRTLGTANGRIAINGQPVLLQGVNRYEEHPEWGPAFPAKLMIRDLDIIAHLGCNVVRGSHFPSRYWLDLLDELGLVYWSELPVWSFAQDMFAEPEITARELVLLDAMIEQEFHHPSVIVWSIYHDVATHTYEGFEITKQYVDYIKSKDKTRLVSCSTHHPLDDLTFGLVDVIAVNKYFGWSGGEVGEFAPFLRQLQEYAATQDAADKPIVVSEFGGAGIFGDVAWEDRRMLSEDYQAHLLGEALRLFRDSGIAGAIVQQFADIRSGTPRGQGQGRGMTNLGLVSEYRKPKLAYRVVRRMYTNAE